MKHAKNQTARREEAPAPESQTVTAEDVVSAEKVLTEIKEADGKAPEQAPEQVAAEVAEELKPVLGKYAKQTAALGGAEAMPGNFKYSGTKLTIGANKPKKETSVMGRIYNHVQANKGLTGAELLRWMQGQSWDGHPTAYGKNKKVCALWAVGFINGAARKKAGHIEVMAD